MITFVTIPKPFTGLVATIQRNALKSWSRMGSGCRVIVFGNDAGVAEAAAEVGALHVPDIAVNEFGTPLLNDLFSRMPQLTDTPLVCYANADIILMRDILRAGEIARARRRPFLMVGQRRDLDVTELIDFESDWDTPLRDRAMREGHLLGPGAIDYFLFPRTVNWDLPPLAVGRPGWDNWMIWRARSMGAMLMDATPSVLAIHQNHDYKHHPQGLRGVLDGPEGLRNKAIVGPVSGQFSVDHATHMVTPDGLKRATDRWHIYRQIKTFPIFHPVLGVPVRFLLWAINFTQPLRARLGLRLPSGKEYRQ